MRIDELKKYYKTWVNLSRSLDIGVNTPRWWLKRGYIPYGRQLLIERKTGGRFIAREEDSVPLPKQKKPKN